MLEQEQLKKKPTASGGGGVEMTKNNG